MRKGPLTRSFDPMPPRPNIPLSGYLSLFMVAGGILLVLSGRFIGLIAGVGVILLAVLIQLKSRMSRRTSTVLLTPRGVSWENPVTGPGALVWSEVGALVVRDEPDKRKAAILLVPRAADGQSGIAITPSDLKADKGNEEQKLLETVQAIVPFLKEDVLVDKRTRAWLSERGVELEGRFR